MCFPNGWDPATQNSLRMLADEMDLQLKTLGMKINNRDNMNNLWHYLLLQIFFLVLLVDWLRLTLFWKQDVFRLWYKKEAGSLVGEAQFGLKTQLWVPSHVTVGRSLQTCPNLHILRLQMSMCKAHYKLKQNDDKRCDQMVMTLNLFVSFFLIDQKV